MHGLRRDEGGKEQGVSRQKEGHDLGFGGPYRPVASVGPREQMPTRRRSAGFSVKPWMMVAGALVAGVAVFGLMKLLSSAGTQIAKHNKQVVGQIDNAKNADAQLAAHTAFITAKSLFMETDSYAGVNAASLLAGEPSFRYTTGPSTGPKMVSVSSSATQLGIAVSAGKTCFYLSDSVTGGTTYGSGTGACTGSAAIGAANAPAW